MTDRTDDTVPYPTPGSAVTRADALALLPIGTVVRAHPAGPWTKTACGQQGETVTAVEDGHWSSGALLLSSAKLSQIHLRPLIVLSVPQPEPATSATDDAEEVEEVAQAIWADHEGRFVCFTGWEDQPEPLRDRYRSYARAAIAHLLGQQTSR